MDYIQVWHAFRVSSTNELLELVKRPEHMEYISYQCKLEHFLDSFEDKFLWGNEPRIDTPYIHDFLESKE